MAGSASHLALSLHRDGRRLRLELFALLSASLFALSYQAQSWDLASWNYENFAPHPGLAIALLLGSARLQAASPSRLDALVWSAIFSALFLAGPSLGPIQPLVETSSAHAGLGVGVFALKLALTQQAVARLAEPARHSLLRRLRPLVLMAALADLAWTLFSA
jgi:hypothetical protein